MRKAAWISQRTALVGICLPGLLGGLLAGCGPSIPEGEEGKRPPNVVLIVVDTLRADHLSSYGYPRPTTPHMDGLAADSLVFREASSAAPWTTASMAALFTSQYPSRLGMRDTPAPFREGFPTLAELLREEGYHTRGIVSAATVSGKLGFDRGFQVYQEYPAEYQNDITSPQISEAALRFLREEREEPFFLYLHYFDPHYNYLLHEEYDYDEDYRGPVRGGLSIKTLWKIRFDLRSEDVDRLVALYDSEVSFTDRYVGQVLDALKEEGLYGESLVVLTADHGEEFMERGWIGHSTGLHREMLHVPLMVKVPGRSAASVEAPVSLIDLMPTLLGALGLTPPEDLAGRRLDLAAPEGIDPQPLFSETSNPQPFQAGRILPINLKSVRLGDRKLICDYLQDSCELFLLSDDPEERSPASPGAEGEALLALLEDWAERSEKWKEGPRPDIEEILSPEQLEELRALGYIQ